MSALKDYLENTRSSGLPAALAEKIDNANGATYAQLLKRPEVTIEDFVPVLCRNVPEFFALADDQRPTTNDLSTLSSQLRNELKSVETEIK